MDAENIVEKVNKGNKTNIIVTVLCIGIIIFILTTQCSVSNIKLNVKDAAIILIFLALLAYINGYNILFMVLLGAFIIIYFTPQKYFDSLLSPIFGKKPKPIIKQVVEEVPYEETEERTYITDNEITLDAEIELDDGFESASGDENVEEIIKKKK